LRAVELCTFIFLPKSLQNVIKYAQQNRLPNLAERVEILRQALLRQGDEEKEKKKKNAAAASRARIQEEERSGRHRPFARLLLLTRRKLILVFYGDWN
jgi:hypothetical protein